MCFVCSSVPWTGNKGTWRDGPSRSHLQSPGGFYRDSCRQRWRQCRLNRQATSLRRGESKVRNVKARAIKDLRYWQEASCYRTHGSRGGRCRWPSRCLGWSPRWPPVYTLMGSLRNMHTTINCEWRQAHICRIIGKIKWEKLSKTHSRESHSPLNLIPDTGSPPTSPGGWWSSNGPEVRHKFRWACEQILYLKGDTVPEEWHKYGFSVSTEHAGWCRLVCCWSLYSFSRDIKSAEGGGGLRDGAEEELILKLLGGTKNKQSTDEGGI